MIANRSRHIVFILVLALTQSIASCAENQGGNEPEPPAAEPGDPVPADDSEAAVPAAELPAAERAAVERANALDIVRRAEVAQYSDYADALAAYAAAVEAERAAEVEAERAAEEEVAP